MNKPKRIQLSRKKGFRKPADAVNVARPTKWGNPFNWKDEDAEMIPASTARYYAVKSFEDWMNSKYEPGVAIHDFIERQKWIFEHLPELRGKDLACWCPLDQPCHADVLLRLANDS